jgi:hypothetical protein
VASIFINDAGHILALALDGEGVRHVLVLTPQFPTPVGNNVAIQSGSTTLTFSSINASGTTTIDPVDPATAATVAGGLAVSNLVAYQVSSTASFSGSVTIGFVVPGPISEGDFSNLRIYHNESGTLQGRNVRLRLRPPHCLRHDDFIQSFLPRRIGNRVTMLTNTTKAFKSGSTIPRQSASSEFGRRQHFVFDAAGQGSGITASSGDDCRKCRRCWKR